MKFYLALSSVEISTVLSLQSMSMICHFNSSCIPYGILSVGCVVFSVLVILSEGPVSLPPWYQSQWWRDGLVRRCNVPPSLITSSLMIFSTGALGPVSIPVPSSGTPAGEFSKIWMLTLLFQCLKSSWVPGMYARAQEIPTNESSNQASQIHCRSCWATLYRPASPVLCLDLRPKKNSRVDRDIKGLIDGMSYISEVKGSWWWKVVAESQKDAGILGL